MAFKNLLITGGAGFVGSNLALSFREAQPELTVTAFDSLKRRGSELNLPRLGAAGVDFRHGDIRIADDLTELPPFDLMVDCSAEPSVQAGLGGSPRPSSTQTCSARLIVWRRPVLVAQPFCS